MLKKQSYLFFLTLFVAVIFSVLGWLVQTQIENELKQKTGESLTTVLHTAHHAISSWAEQEKTTALVWAKNQRIREATAGLLETERKQDKLINSPFQKAINSILTPLLLTKGYKGYFIIDRDNISLASSRNENTGTKNLLSAQMAFLVMWVSEGNKDEA